MNIFTVSYNGEKILTDKLLDTIKNEDNIELRIKLNKRMKGGFGIIMFTPIFPERFL